MARHKPAVRSLPFDTHPTALSAPLLVWFDAHHRKLPWRSNRDPYRIWVSEVMLQQTTVTAVIPFFERFLAAFPTIVALAAADEQRVLKLWEGLGYYRRARHLHAAARQLVASHPGELPNDPDVWHSLPGVGRYILGAVLSQAFDRALPIVEANSLRVLARLFGYRGDPREGEGKAWVWSAAESMLPQKRVGDFNQALMELGSLICTPTRPACEKCPLAAQCVAHSEGLQEKIPPPKRQPVITAVSEVGIVIRRGKQILLCRRPANAGRWQNMWEVPHAERIEGEELSVAAVRVAKELTGLTVKPGDEIIAIRHSVTRYRITLACVEATAAKGTFAPGFYTEAKWLTVAELADYPVSAPQRKLVNALVSARDG
ncbi:MAG: A/G-specific adenine glycosylase [Planctomycetaceae bacterium]|nr:A/G-specific adenine glycosylase [Planctomycetaceae bacterium]